MSDFPVLKTERLLLREVVAADAPALFAIYGNADAMRWFGTDPFTEFHEAEQLVEKFASWRTLPNPGTRWGISRRSDAQLVGTCGLFKWNRGWRCCTLGYELAPAAWGKGFMFEALSAILAWGFEHMALNRVEAQIHPENLPSLKLTHALGFVEEGLLRQAGFWLGEYRDLLQHSLLREEYLQRSSGPSLKPVGIS